MNVAVTVICCLIPCIGIVLGLMFLQKGKQQNPKDSGTGKPSAALSGAVGVRILLVAAVLLVVTILVLVLAPMDTAKIRLVTAILLVTAQYVTAMVLIFMINGMLRRDREQRKNMQGKENA